MSSLLFPEHGFSWAPRTEENKPTTRSDLHQNPRCDAHRSAGRSWEFICLWGCVQWSQLPQIYPADCGEPAKPLLSLNLLFLRKWHWIKNQFCLVFMMAEQDTAHSLEIFSSRLVKTKLESEGTEERSPRPATHCGLFGVFLVWRHFWSVLECFLCAGLHTKCIKFPFFKLYLFLIFQISPGVTQWRPCFIEWVLQGTVLGTDRSRLLICGVRLRGTCHCPT